MIGCCARENMNEEKCFFCGGTGRDLCSACDGKGKVGGFLGLGAKTCPVCEGTRAENCTSCNGTGKELEADKPG